MIERTIVLPLQDNEGNSLDAEIKSIQRELLRIAGGYSQLFQQGVWMDEATGEIYTDHSIRLCTTVDEQKDKRIEEKLAHWCADLKQLCLYTHTSSVQAQFVEPVPSREGVLV